MSKYLEPRITCDEVIKQRLQKKIANRLNAKAFSGKMFLNLSVSAFFVLLGIALKQPIVSLIGSGIGVSFLIHKK